ncbi:MAG TPA: tetratricopeptide repeat protein, partial [bacterium]|nr:tetratricopeptide repeat protein [bacterium]
MKPNLRKALRTAFLLLALLALSGPARVKAASPGEEAYRNKDFEAAEKYFGERAQKNPNDVADAYGWGNALYQQGKYGEAEKAYSQAIGKN